MTGPPLPAAPYPGLRILLSVMAVVFGLGMIALVVAVGDCGAFGGRCPAESPPLWEDDVFGGAAFGGALAFGLPVWLVRPTAVRARVALVVGLMAALAVGLIARAATTG